MGKRDSGVHSPSVASTMRSAVTALLGFVALPAIPLGSTLDRLVELVREITDVAHSSRRQELMDFGEHVSAVVNQLVVALRNEQLSKQANVRRNLEVLQRQVQSVLSILHLGRVYGIVLTGFFNSLRTLDKILRNIYYINSPRDFISRLRRALFPEDDQMHVVRMRQQLEDAMRLFQFAAACELLSRPQTLPQDRAVVDTPTQAQQIIHSPSSPSLRSRTECQEHSIINNSELAQVGHVSPSRDPLPQKQQTRQRSGAFVAAAPPIPDSELETENQEVASLRRLFHRSRRPLPAMQLAVALGRYSDLLVKSGRTAEALAASQESAKLFKALAEKGPEIYFDSD